MARRGTENDPLAANTMHGWRWRAPALGAALAGAMMLLASAANAALPVCKPTISACCRITKPGDYAVSENLNGSGGACIKILASGVVLDGSGFSLTGNGTGIGIRLLPAAASDVVYSSYPITGFKTGILDDAPGSLISGDGVSSNAENGIVIRANRVSLLISSADLNGGNGVVVEPRAPATVVSNVYLGGVTASDNTQAGFLLGSLSTFMAEGSSTDSNGTDGADLIDSINANITDGSSYGNTGDGIKVVRSHDDTVDDETLGKSGSGNAIGLEVRNSAFDTIDDNTIRYNTGDGALVVNGNGEKITYTESITNGGSGIHLKRSTSSRVSEVTTEFNAGAGVWLDGSRRISVDAVTSVENGKSDVYIGCSSAQEPDGTTCASHGLPASNGNRVVQGSFDYNSGTKPDVGIGIDLDDHNNQVLRNHATGNTIDAMDENTDCDSNVWMFNTFTTASPSSCIH